VSYGVEGWGPKLSPCAKCGKPTEFTYNDVWTCFDCRPPPDPKTLFARPKEFFELICKAVNNASRDLDDDALELDHARFGAGIGPEYTLGLEAKVVAGGVKIDVIETDYGDRIARRPPIHTFLVQVTKVPHRKPRRRIR